MTVSEWADEYRRLSSESSAEPGRWRTSKAPYQREIAIMPDFVKVVFVEPDIAPGQRRKRPAYRARHVPFRGFHLNALASLFVEWREIVEKFLTANEEKKKGNIELLKAWTIDRRRTYANFFFIPERCKPLSRK
mgnify:CR=1 FL=1